MRSRKPSTSISLTPCRPAANGALSRNRRRRPIGGIEPRQHARESRALRRCRRMSACATASPSDPMPSCSVPPSTTVRATCSPAAYSARSIGSRGGANSGKSVCGALQHQIEFAGRDIGVARHERQLGVDLPDDQQKSALPAPAGGQQIDGEVGIAAQAVAGLAAAHALGDQLRDHVDAALEHVAQGVGVVGGDVVALRRGDAEPAAGLEEELVDLHVGRQPAGTLGDGIGEVGIAAEQALRERRDEAPLADLPWRAASPGSAR